jgi:hypothetical protein
LTAPVAINNRGQVTGLYAVDEVFNGVTFVNFEGFLYDHGTWTNLSDPSSSNPCTSPNAINNRGQIVGVYSGGGFLYDHGTWTTLNDPSAVPGTTDPNSINNRGQISGVYFNGTAEVGFVYDHGTWTTLNVPSAVPDFSDPGVPETTPVSINDRGQVTGYYFNGTTKVGFIATPTGAGKPQDPPKLTDTTHGEHAATSSQTSVSANQLAALFHQYVAAGFNNDHAGGGITSASQMQNGLQDHLPFLSNPHHST